MTLHNFKITTLFAALLGLGVAAASSVGFIGTGNVGVRTTLKSISLESLPEGMYFKWPFISTVNEYSTKENVIELNDLTPKALDNLSLKDLDLSIFYQVSGQAVAHLEAEYASQTERIDGLHRPASSLIRTLARNAIYEEVSRIDSLVIHTRREQLAAAIQKNLQNDLDRKNPGAFTVKTVAIRAVTTDPAIEESIRRATQAKKELEFMDSKLQIAVKDKQIKVTEAEGIAEAQRIIAGTLTKEYLQHEANQSIAEFAKKGGGTNTVILPSGFNANPLINIGK